MKMVHAVLGAVCVLIVGALYQLNGNSGDSEGAGNIFTRFKLRVFEDNKPTENYIVGHLFVYEDSGSYLVSWQDVWISPLHKEKQMMLKPEYNGVDHGDIKNLAVGKGHFSFDIVLEPGRVMQITGTMVPNSEEFRVEGVGTWPIDPGKKPVKTEWKSVTKPILLPYKELF